LIALATCGAFPDLDPDDRLLAAALGGRAVPAVWDDPAVDWERFERVVVRSTWDYTGRRDEFLAWAERVGARRLRNPPDVLRWSTDKRYLAELDDAGLPVVETAFVAAGEPLPAPPLVVKPPVGAGSIDAARHDDPGAATEHVARLGTALVQPYVQAEETALVYLGGAFSHAIRKGPMLDARAEPAAGGLFLDEEITAVDPTADERAAADRVMAWVTERFGTLVYARIDLLGGAVLEVELAEPSLFLAHAPGAAERLAAAIL
jgi:glutathione synthase/RimK-type ligase-like ATP-grasp enzyme